MSTDLLLRNGRPSGGPLQHILIRAGRIAAIGPDPIVERLGRQSAGSAPVPVVDIDGALVLPGFVEAHTHLDKTLWGLEWRPHAAGPALEDKIDDERRMRREIDLDPARQSARLVALAVAHGSTHIRSHVDIDTEQGLRGIEGVMATREASAAQVDIELVAFPQSGLLRRPGTFDLMEAALRSGVEVVGGLDPCAIDRDPKGHLDAIFDLAHRHGRAIDIHLHEPGEMGAFSLELIFERVRALGMQGRVVVSHAFCLGSLERERVEVLVEQLSALQIAIMTTGPAARPTPPVKRLLEAGVRVCAGSDGVRDAWSPYGNADMLERAMLIGLRNNFRRDEDIALALHACTQGGADALHLADYGLRVGGFADLVVVAGESVAQAVAARPPRRAVVKRGRIVARDGAVCDVRP